MIEAVLISNRSDLLIVGDSLTLAAIDPVELDLGTHPWQQSWNLSTPAPDMGVGLNAIRFLGRYSHEIFRPKTEGREPIVVFSMSYYVLKSLVVAPEHVAISIHGLGISDPAETAKRPLNGAFVNEVVSLLGRGWIRSPISFPVLLNSLIPGTIQNSPSARASFYFSVWTTPTFTEPGWNDEHRGFTDLNRALHSKKFDAYLAGIQQPPMRQFIAAHWVNSKQKPWLGISATRARAIRKEIASVQDAGFRVIVVLNPLSPATKLSLDEHRNLEGFKSALRFSGIALVDYVSEKNDFAEGDFYDIGHLTDVARKRWTTMFRRDLTSEISRMRPPRQ